MTPQPQPSAIAGPARVVFHADDFGFSRAVSDGILRGFEQGLLTSTSLLANAPDADRALERWKQLQQRLADGVLPSAAARRELGDPFHPFDLGIHLNLTQGRPLTGPAYPLELLDSEGRFLNPARLLWRLCRHRRSVVAGVKAELRQQTQFVWDHGLRPTHLNGHQYVEMMPVVMELVPEVLAEFDIRVVRVPREPRLCRSTLVHRFSLQRYVLGQIKRAFAGHFARRLRRMPIASPQAFFGTVHAGCIDLELLRVFLQRLPAGTTAEIGLHPAEAAGTAHDPASADGWLDPLAVQRRDELRFLLSAELGQYLASQGYRLGRLAELASD